MQIHTPHRGTRCGCMCVGGGGEEPLLEFLICSSISKRFYLQWKAFDLVYKMGYILWVLALLGACDVTMFAHFQEYHRYREKNEQFTWFGGTLFVWISFQES